MSEWIFFFNDTATTEIYTLSLHDALPICIARRLVIAFDQVENVGRLARRGDAALAAVLEEFAVPFGGLVVDPVAQDRKSTRLNSSHANISYAVFCLKKKKSTHITTISSYY